MKKSRSILCAVLAGLLLTVSAFNFIIPAYAHLERTSTWTGLVSQPAELQEEDTTLSQRLEDAMFSILVEGGQTVLLGEVDDEILIPLYVPYDGITLEVSDPDWVSAEILETGTVLRISSPLQKAEEESTDPGKNDNVDNEETGGGEGTTDPTEPPPAADEESGEGGNTPPATGEESGEGGNTPPATDEESGEGGNTPPPAADEESGESGNTPPATGEESGEGENTPPSTGEETSGSGDIQLSMNRRTYAVLQRFANETGGGESNQQPADTPPEELPSDQPPDGETGGSTDGKDEAEDSSTGGKDDTEDNSTDDKNDAKDTGSQPESPPATDEEPGAGGVGKERPEHVRVEVTWTNGIEVRSAVFDLSHHSPEELGGDMVIDSQLRFYHPEIPIVLQADETIGSVVSWNDGVFPEMTRYTVVTETYETETYLLYRPDKLYLPAGALATLDLSLLEPEDTICISAGTVRWDLAYYELPDFAGNERPIVMGNSGLMVPMPFFWGSYAGEVTIERLEMGEDGLNWVEDDSIDCTEYAPTGEVQMTPTTSTTAGTYRASIAWRDDVTEYTRTEFPFFVFYDSGITQSEVRMYRYAGSGTKNPLGIGREMEVMITHYCACAKCCDVETHITASGKTVERGMVAMSAEYPFGTQIEIDGILYTVEDRGGAITGNRVDIYVPTHEEALSRGTGAVMAIVYLPDSAEMTEASADNPN